jgi:hypothetical protein
MTGPRLFNPSRHYTVRGFRRRTLNHRSLNHGHDNPCSTTQTWACASQQKLFRDTFGRSVEVTEEVCLKHAAQSQSASAQEAYIAATVSALEAYDAATVSAWEAFNAARALAFCRAFLAQ